MWKYHAVLGAAAMVVVACGDGTGEPEQVQGDVTQVIESVAVEDMPALARGLLDSERPWRAAQVMRRYLAEVSDPAPVHVMLAAQAEAGWRAWPRVMELLGGLPELESHEDGLGLYLMGRALDDAGEADSAAVLYRRFLTSAATAPGLSAERGAAQLRLGLALLRAGEADGGRRALAESRQRAGAIATPWLDVLEADALAQAGDTAGVRTATADLESGILGLRAWRARVDAAMQAGDVAGARALANRARAWAQTDATRAEFLVSAARAALAMGDTAAAQAALRGATERATGSGHARAAAALLAQTRMSPADELAVSRVQRAQGLHEESLDGFRRWLAEGRGTAAEQRDVRLEYANALFYAERYDEVEAALRPIAGVTAARLLRARAAAHDGDDDEAVRIYLELADQFSGSGTGVQALFLAAGTRHDEGAFDEARELYRQVVSRYPGTDQMGLSLMRLAGMAFIEEEYAAAARIWQQYLDRYPRGSRSAEARYWAARAHEEAGDEARAAAGYRAVREQERDGYYGLLASRRLDQPFWPVPMTASPSSDAAALDRVRGWVSGIDMLRAAGFDDAASGTADRVLAEAGNEPAVLYALAEALAERGYSQRAIRIGLRLQGNRGQTNERLLRILYPFPYRTLITEEARERGFDPFIAAALIRQESMFEARITSPAGARGLMQIMPLTARELAEQAEIENWNGELLYQPEINVHLGTRYVARHLGNYEGSLPSVFSAYNAGWHRVEWWSEFPEYENEELFTERIPYRETRDYVKILTRNRALYEGLYGGTDAAESGG